MVTDKGSEILDATQRRGVDRQGPAYQTSTTRQGPKGDLNTGDPAATMISHVKISKTARHVIASHICVTLSRQQLRVAERRASSPTG